MSRVIRDRSILILLLGLVLAMFGAAPASAHAILVRSLPVFDAELAQPPAKIELWFSEPLENGVNRVRLLTSAGKKISLPAPALDPADPTHLTIELEPLPPGIYTVAWKNLSQFDGHEWSGSFPFTVLNTDGTRPAGLAVSAAEENRNPVPSPGETLARWLALLGGALFFGAPLFLLLVVRADNLLLARAHNLALQALWVAVLAIVLGAWLQILLQTGRLGGLPALPSLLLETRTNALILTRQILALSGLLLVLNLPQPRPLHNQETTLFVQLLAAGAGAILLVVLLTAQTAAGWGWMTAALVSFGLAGVTLVFPQLVAALQRQLWPALLLLAGLLLFTFSGSSHANVLLDTPWPLLADYVHLLAAATWVGGLLLLALLAWQLRRANTGSEQLPQLVLRFSLLASLSVFVLILTGLFSSLVQLPDLAALGQTPYGLVLLGKLGLVALAWLVALLNNRQVHRRAASLHTPAGQQQFRRQVGLEAVVSLAIMVTVAMLTQTTTPRNLAQEVAVQQPAIPFNQVIKANDFYIYLQIDPNRVGRNTFLVHLYKEDQTAVGDVQLVRLIFDYQDEPLGQTKIDLKAGSPTDFSATGAYLNRGGNWRVSVYVRRRGLDDSLVHFDLAVPVSGQGAPVPGWLQNSLPGPDLLPAMMLPVAGLGSLLVLLGWRFWPKLRTLMALMISLV